MAKKKKTLPKDFEQLLKQSNLEELKEIFEKTELDAVGGYSKQTALAFDNCPHELAKWLVGQGADLEAPDDYRNTPLQNRSRSIFGNIQSLLLLGADVNLNTPRVGTALHTAAGSHNVENTAILIRHGARVDIIDSEGLIPLEQALRLCNNIDIVNTLKISKIYLAAGIQITAGMKKTIADIGTRFEFHRAGFNPETVEEVSNALEELYRIFQVAPIEKRNMHDVKSSITTNETAWQKQHKDFWNQLVPSSGAATTIQGELIRISGRIENELDGNGGANWDEDFKKMADAFLGFVKEGNQLSQKEIMETEGVINEIKKRSGNPELLGKIAVNWVLKNPVPLKLPKIGYKR